MARSNPAWFQGGVQVGELNMTVRSVDGQGSACGVQVNNYNTSPNQALSKEDIEDIEKKTRLSVERERPGGVVWTRAMDSCRRALAQNICVIVGKAGDGKTATAHEVLRSFQKESRILQLHDHLQLQGFVRYLDDNSSEHDEKFVVFFDDLLRGCSKMFETRKDFGPMEKTFVGLRAHFGKIKLLLTRNDEVSMFENLQKSFFNSNFKDASTVDLNSREDRLTDEEKVSIFRKFLSRWNWQADMEIGVMTTACQRIGAVGFPEACRVALSKDRFCPNDLLQHHHRKKLAVANAVVGVVNIPGLVQQCKTLIKPDRDPSVDLEGNTTIHFAVLRKDTKALTRYLQESRAQSEIDVQNKLGQTALHLAALGNSAEGVRLLLDHKARADIKDRGGNLPLHLAVENSSPEITQRLVSDGPRRLLHCRNGMGSTALHLAARKKQVNTARILLEGGADVNATDAEGNSFLHLAASAGCSRLIYLLVSRQDFDINLENKEGKTPLLVSTSPEATTALLDLGARGDVTDKGGNSPQLLADKEDNPDECSCS